MEAVKNSGLSLKYASINVEKILNMDGVKNDIYA
jgi:hypothetical protein